MSAIATRRRGSQLSLGTERTRRENFDLDRLRRERVHCSDGGRLTLEQALDGVWEGLHAAGVADCVWCGGRVEETVEGAGRCDSCGTSVS